MIEADSLADGLCCLLIMKLKFRELDTVKKTKDTLISEEVLLLAKYLRNERKTWIPRLARLS